MTREIKFRAWTDNLKNGGEMYYQREDQYFNPLFSPAGYGLLNPSLKLMQFTGLLDKNGKEVYEGDLLQYDGYNFKLINKEKIYQIKYDDNLAQYYAYNLENSFDTFLVVRAWKESKIIGNIYQNPERVGN